MYPLDLDERIKKYLIDNNEKWNPKKHHIYIHNELLVIDQWLYKCKIPSTKDINIFPLKIIINK